MGGEGAAVNRFMHHCGADCRAVRFAWQYEVNMVRELHRYGSDAGRAAVSLVCEVCDTKLVTQWKPPLPSVCVAMGYGVRDVVSLSRMVKVGDYRTSKLLRMAYPNMRARGYKAIVTYSDSSLGHSGNVYRLSGFTPQAVLESPFYVDENGNRTSPAKCGRKDPEAVFAGVRQLTRWVKVL